jgi:hypothetical protein
VLRLKELRRRHSLPETTKRPRLAGALRIGEFRLLGCNYSINNDFVKGNHRSAGDGHGNALQRGCPGTRRVGVLGGARTRSARGRGGVGWGTARAAEAESEKAMIASVTAIGTQEQNVTEKRLQQTLAPRSPGRVVAPWAKNVMSIETRFVHEELRAREIDVSTHSGP